jgi:HAD superfamily hydrolase (TIGR01490 family)
MALALFDLDRTLVRADTAGLFVRYEFRNRSISPLRVARVALWRLLYTVGVVDAERVARQVLAWYDGRDVEELRRSTELWFASDVLPLICERGRRAVAEHRARGDVIALVTASSQFVAERVAAALEIDHVICTEVDAAGGRLTGELRGPLCFGQGKLEKVEAFVRTLPAPGVRLTEATAYTDSITDLPLLSSVRHPVVVNPDFRLRAHARERRWRIERW